MQLIAGPVSLLFDNGSIRTLTIQGEEVLRMIYVTLRDADWNTANVLVTNQALRQEVNSFTITYDWQVDDLGIQMAGNVAIEGKADGTVVFDFYGKARNTFQRNRVGLCVLHPIAGLSGQPCLLTHPDGQTTESLFPVLIQPDQSFKNLSGLTWLMASGQRCSLHLSGDVFETEDQRNWSDASYKTYPTPVDLPRPVTVETGTEIRQQVAFRLLADADPTLRPRIGLGHRPDGPPLSAHEAGRLKTRNLSHIRTSVNLSQPNWQDRLAAAQRDADLLNLPLEIALFFGTDAPTDAQEFIRFILENNVRMCALALFDADTRRTSDALLQSVVPLFRTAFPDVLLGGGADAHFTDLNRCRFDVGPVDFVTYSISPQVHAFDDQTLLENIAGQAQTVQSARTLANGKPVHILSVTLLPRYNADAPPADGIGMPPADPRQKTAFGADWTRRSLAALTQAGAASVTYYETHGPRGLLDGEAVFPMFDVF